MTETAAPHRYQIELANKVRRGRAVGNEYVVTRRPEGMTTILARFDSHEEAQAWIDRGGLLQDPPLPTPTEFWTSVRERSEPGSSGRVLADGWLAKLAKDEASRSPGFHGWIESGPDGQGRHRFVLFWYGEVVASLPPTRAQHFHAQTMDYKDVTWHPTEAEAQEAAWGTP
jgi:hypothetical protein